MTHWKIAKDRFLCFFIFSASILFTSPVDAIEPRIVPAVYWRATEAMGVGDYPTARRLFSTMLLGKDFYFNAYWRLTQCYAVEGQFDKGQIFFANLLKKGAPAGEVYSALAFLAELRGDRQRIAEYCWKAVQHRTAFLSIHQKLIDWAPASGLEQQVLEHLKTRLAKNPDDWLAQYTLAYWETFRAPPEVSAAKFARLIADGHQSWRLYFRWATQLMLMSKLDSAHLVVDRGLHASQAINDKDGEGQLLNFKSHVYMRQGRLNIADSLLNRVKQLSVAIGYLDLQADLAATLSGIRLRQGRLQEALSQAILAGELSAKLNYKFSRLQAYHYTADAYRALGLYEKAIQEWTQGYQLADSLQSASHRHLMAHNLAVVYQTLGDHQRAKTYFEEVIAYARQHQQTFYLASYLRSLAASLTALNRLRPAKLYYEEALAIAQRSKLTDLQCGIMLDLAEFWQKSDDWQKAEQAVIAALAIARQAQLKTSTREAVLQLAEIELHNHQLARAEGHFREARRLSVETQIYTSLIASLNGLGRVAIAKGDYRNAAAILEEGSALVSRRVFSEHVGKPSPFLSFEKELFFSLSRAYVRLQQPARALELAERMRDLIVRRRLQQASLLTRAHFGDSLGRQAAYLDTLLLKKRLQLAALSSPDSSAQKMKLRLAITGLEIRQNQFWEKIGMVAEQETLLQNAWPLTAFQQKLAQRRELALVYVVGNEGVLIFALNGDTLSAYEAPGDARSLQALVGSVNAAAKYALQDSQSLQLISPLLFRYEPQAAAQLYQMLMARFVEKMAGKKLLIIPDEHLHFLPFDLLLQTASADTAAKDYRCLAFMLKNYAFRYASSLAAAFEDSPEQVQIPATVLAFAEAQPQGNGETAGAPNLWQTQQEVERIRKILGGAAVKIMEGDWSRERRWQNDLGQYAVLHFAGHSEAQNADPLSSRIILAERRTEPRSLYAFEIFAMHLPKGRLAFLSSCNTAAGILRGSEGLQGFTQAFRAAGVPSVIGSLWPVDSETSSVLAARFYLYLRDGESAAEALRKAKLFLLEGDKPNPFFWAAFQYYGVDQTLRFQRSIKWTPFLSFFLFILLIGAMRKWRGPTLRRA
jgi:CHAT domain-containing protein